MNVSISERLSKLPVQICRRYLRHHPRQQRSVAAHGTWQRADVHGRRQTGQAEQPETQLQHVDWDHFQGQQRRRHTTAEPAPLSGIARCSCMKMLGVTVGNDFSISQRNVQRLVTSSAQARYALRVLRTRGLDDAALQHVLRATVVARLTYAASVWCSLGVRSTSHQFCARPRPAPRILSTGPADIILMNCVTPPTKNYSVQESCAIAKMTARCALYK